MNGFESSLSQFKNLSLTRIHYWSSDWGSEWQPHCVNATSNVEIAVTSGRSSKGYHPFIIVEDGERAYFLAVAWSGNWRITTFCSSKTLKIYVDSDCNDLQVITSCVESGGIAECTKDFISKFRTIDSSAKPKLLTEWNSWWPYEDIEINEEVFLSNAVIAKKAGIEVALLDAGWFGPSHIESHWHDVRGDWGERNTERFPSGLSHIAQNIRDLGMEFGIWLEIEAIGKKAQILIEHPDFMAQYDGNDLGYLCLANPKALTWAENVSQNLIEECNAAWIKMDFNIDPGPGCNRNDHGHPSLLGLNNHLLGLYQLLDSIKLKNPDLIVENCSSGGLRWDLAMAQHVDFGFSSDTDWPEHALSCFWASSLFFPVEKLLGWCDSQWRGEHPNQSFNAIESSDSDLEFALSIALLGGFGISARLPDFSIGRQIILQEYVSIYKKEFRPRFQSNAFVKHLTPQPELYSQGCRSIAFAIEADAFNPIIIIYQLDHKNLSHTIEYTPPSTLAHYKIINARNGEVLCESHQGIFTFINVLAENTSLILLFKEI